jgi:hypothetical protein
MGKKFSPKSVDDMQKATGIKMGPKLATNMHQRQANRKRPQNIKISPRLTTKMCRRQAKSERPQNWIQIPTKMSQTQAKRDGKRSLCKKQSK